MKRSLNRMSTLFPSMHCSSVYFVLKHGGNLANTARRFPFILTTFVWLFHQIFAENKFSKLLLLLYLLLTAVCVSIYEPRDVEFFMVHMLKPDRSPFLGASLGLAAQRLWPACYSYSAEGRGETALYCGPPRHSSAFVTATLHAAAAAPRWRRKQKKKKKKAGSWRMSGSWIGLGFSFHDWGNSSAV